MSQNFRCGDSESLVSYLYGECEASEHLAITSHVAHCGDCAEELAALGATRAHLASWTPPGTQLGFQIVRTPESRSLSPESHTRQLPWWQQPMPAWAQAVAAALIFGIGVTMGTVRGDIAPAQRAATPNAGVTGASAVSASDLTSLEQRLRAEMSQVRPASASAVSSVAPAAGDAQVLQRVRALIEESEQRQQRELALRAAEILRDFDSQRRDDLARIERTFGQMEGTTGAEVAQQRQMLNYLMRVSETAR